MMDDFLFLDWGGLAFFFFFFFFLGMTVREAFPELRRSESNRGLKAGNRDDGMIGSSYATVIE